MPSVAHEHLSEFVTDHLTRFEIVALGQQIARKHGHVLKPPRDQRLARAWFAGYIAKSLSRPDALKYLKELAEGRRRATTSSVRRENLVALEPG